MNRTTSGIVLSEFVLSGDPLYLRMTTYKINELYKMNTAKAWKLRPTIKPTILQRIELNKPITVRVIKYEITYGLFLPIRIPFFIFP